MSGTVADRAVHPEDNRRESARSLDPLLHVEGLRTYFPIRGGVLKNVRAWVKAVDGVDLVVAPRSTLALVGESGCGKTTVGRSILRLEKPQAGKIRFDGVDLLTLEGRALLPYRRRIQMVFQDAAAALDPRMRVADAIAEGMRSFGLGDGASARADRVRALLGRVQLDASFAHRYPHELSGGQRQRVCIARALAVEPELIVCDESVSALDVSIQAQILNLLRDLQEERGLAYLFITHDLGVVRYLADRVAVMYVGQVVEEGETEALFAAPRHPYTRALLAAAPALDAPLQAQSSDAPAVGSIAAPLRGEVPSSVTPPSGCRFHPRCPEAFDRCSREAPPLYTLPGGARSRCFLVESEATAAQPDGNGSQHPT